MSDEIWKDVVGYEGIYVVSNLGRIKRTLVRRGTSGGLMAQSATGPRRNYLGVNLCSGNVRRPCKMHRIVAMAFCPGYAPGMHCNHIDGNTLNNRADNLEWVTQTENNRHAFRIGKMPLGELRYGSKLSNADIPAIVARLEAGERQEDIAKAYDVSTKNISNIKLGRSWSWLTGRKCA